MYLWAPQEFRLRPGSLGTKFLSATSIQFQLSAVFVLTYFHVGHSVQQLKHWETCCILSSATDLSALRPHPEYLPAEPRTSTEKQTHPLALTVWFPSPAKGQHRQPSHCSEALLSQKRQGLFPDGSTGSAGSQYRFSHGSWFLRGAGDLQVLVRPSLHLCTFSPPAAQSVQWEYGSFLPCTQWFEVCRWKVLCKH